MPNRKTGFTIIEIIILFAVLGIILVLGSMFISKMNSPANSLKLLADKVTLKPTEVIEALQNKLSETYTFKNDGEISLDSSTIVYNYSKVAGTHPSSNGAYFFNNDKGYAINMLPGGVEKTISSPSPKSNDVKLRQEVADIYQQIGLTKSKSYTTPNVPSADEWDTYSGKGVECNIQSTKSSGGGAYASCNEVSALKTSDDQLLAFYEALPAEDKQNDNSIILSGVTKITQSPVAGYQRAEIKMFTASYGSVALFYKKNDAKWVFFKYAQGTTMCSEFNTLDLQNAFKGTSCQN